jgi:hypothetical protein
MPDAEPIVKCVDCGFVALRRTTTRKLVEIEFEIRQNGKIPDEQVVCASGKKQYEPWLYCFRQRYVLRDEQNKIAGGHEQMILAVISAERHCGKFKKWEQGWSPKGHIEMDLLERQQVREDKRDADNRNFLIEQGDKARRHERRTLAVSIVAVVVAVVALVANTAISLLKTPPTIILRQPGATTPNAAPLLRQTNPQTTTVEPSPQPSSPE